MKNRGETYTYTVSASLLNAAAVLLFHEYTSKAIYSSPQLGHMHGDTNNNFCGLHDAFVSDVLGNEKKE
jgi:hypothetical protein